MLSRANIYSSPITHNAWTLTELPQQQKYDDESQEQIDECEGDQRDGEVRYRRYCLCRAHNPGDYERLPPDLGYCPAGFDGDEAQWRGQDKRAQKPPLIRQRPAPKPAAVAPRQNQRGNTDGGHCQAASDHDLKCDVHNSYRGTIRLGPLLQPFDLGLRVVKYQNAETVRNFQSVICVLRRFVRQPADAQRRTLFGLELAFEGGQLARLFARQAACIEIAAERQQN